MESNLDVQDPAHLFPIFPYIVDEQQLLAVPDYVKAFEAHAKIALREEIIQEYDWAGEQPYPVVYLTLRDGVGYALSAMQATLILMGALHYHQLEPHERGDLNKTLQRRIPITERARNPRPLERPYRTKRGNEIIDPGGTHAKHSAARIEAKKTMNSIDTSEFDIDLDDIEIDFDDI